MKYLAVDIYTANFPDPIPNNPLHFILGYPSELILIKLSKINAILFHEKDERVQISLILMQVIFEGTRMETPELEKLIEDCTSGHKTFFSAAPIGMLLKAVLENPNPGRPEQQVDTLGFGRDLFRTILIFNELYYSRIHDYELTSFKGIFAMDSMQQQYIRSNLSGKVITLMKFAFICKFLVTHPLIKPYCKEFCSYFGIGNPWMYARFVIEMLTRSSGAGKLAKHIMDPAGIPENIIREFTINSEERISSRELSFSMEIIPHPFYKLDANNLLILDLNFFHFAIEQGIFWAFFKHTSLANTNRFKNYNAFKSFIGLEYFEKFLVAQYVKAIFFRRNQIIISTDKYQDFIVKPTSDNVLLIETKMIDLNGKTIEQMDFERFISFLDNNFLGEKVNGGKAKGVAQLFTQINNLKADDPELRNLLAVKNAAKLNLYPIIVYSDANWDISGVNSHVNDWFGDKLGEISDAFQTVKPVLMMHIDILVEYFTLLRQDSKKFTELANAYFAYVKKWKQTFQTDRSPHAYLQYNRSFSSYLTDKVSQKEKEIDLREMASIFDLHEITLTE